MQQAEFEIAGTQFERVLEEGKFFANPSSALTLPISLVCGMSSASYQFPEQKQALMDALSPFQIVSKFWSTMALNNLLMMDPDIETIVYVGSWFGQQSALASRYVRNYLSWKVELVDADPEACRVAQYLINHDSYHQRNQPTVRIADIFTLRDKYQENTVFVWNGLEHFDNDEVEKFLESNTGSSFIFQSTSMEADDHTNLATDIEDLTSCIPPGWDDIVYRGEILCELLGSRYMMAVRGPECDPIQEEESESDGLDGPNR